MKIYLSALGWVTDAPPGNRLRWRYPFSAVQDGKLLGLPESLLIERAMIKEEIRQFSPYASTAAGVPASWWDELAPVNLSGTPPLVHDFSPTIQALHFQYRGERARLMIRDPQSETVYLDRVVTDGETVSFEAPEIGQLLVFAYSAVLEQLRTLDLFRERPLPWSTIAEVKPSATATAPYDHVLTRWQATPDLTRLQWEELTRLQLEAAAGPTTEDDQGPAPWDRVEAALAVRWQFAVLYGMGFRDGPRSTLSVLDAIDMAAMSTAPPSSAVAYRVREKAGRVSPSNVSVCPPLVAPPLLAPSLTVHEPRVSMRYGDEFIGEFTLRWSHSDGRAIGVAVNESISASLSRARDEIVENYESRGRSLDEPRAGEAFRTINLPFHDVTLNARAQAIDGWDRVSDYSSWCGSTPFELRHFPVAPPLESAFHAEGQVRILRQSADEHTPEWRIDPVVREAGGTVRIYRQTAQPRILEGTTSTPVWVDGDQYRVSVNPVPGPVFAGGYLNAGTVKASITRIEGAEIFFNLRPEGLDTVTVFSAGPCLLQQDIKDLSLWMQVAEFPAEGLPRELSFPDLSRSMPEEVEVYSYCARLAFLGRLGPPSNAVQVIRRPLALNVPPDFTFQLLGEDFYNRTMVLIRMTRPVPHQRFTIWWAKGTWDQVGFGLHAVPGSYGIQAAHDGQFLFDVLPLPVPRRIPMSITLGVQQVNEGGARSAFSVLPVTLPPS